MPLSRRLRVATVALASLLVPLAWAPPAAAGGEEVLYEPPVDAAVTDPFRAPADPYAPGNRGVDYDTDVGDPVAAAAAGLVVFAGRVGQGLHVTILHADGVRTSYSFLDTIAVRRGERVDRGDTIATAGPALHLGARLGDAYVDPRHLFAGRRRARLVDDDAVVVPARASIVAELRRLAPAPTPRDISGWDREQHTCTPRAEAARAVAARQPGRRVALLVAGLGSSTGHAAVLDVDTATLGYAPGDVHQFSYRSDGAPYSADDTHQDIETSAERLAATLEALAARHPGVPIDVIAHSQGGLVARAALAASPASFDTVSTVVTIGTPHGGNTLAAAAPLLGRRVAVAGTDTGSDSMRQLARGSAFLRRLSRERRPPTHVEVRSIGASTDPVVPAGSSRWPGALHAVVDLEGAASVEDHSRVTSDPATTAEIALAVADRPPICVGYAEWLGRQADGALLERGHRVARRLAGLAGSPAPARGTAPRPR